MAASRRIFIKNSLGVISAGMLAPSLLLENAPASAAPLTRNTDGFRVVKVGATSDAANVPWAVIVVPANKSAVVDYAVQELQWHLQRATKTTLSVLSELEVDSSTMAHRIYVGQQTASQNAGIVVSSTPNSYCKKVTSDCVYLIGKDDNSPLPANTTIAPTPNDDVWMGTLFAVYDWLEHQVGVQWLWPGEQGTVVPAINNIYSGPAGVQTISPALIHSRVRLNLQFIADSSPNKTQYVLDHNVWLRRQRYARGTSFEYGHAFTNYWTRFGNNGTDGKHLEFFALLPNESSDPLWPVGYRRPVGDPKLVQMCVSNPLLHQQIIQDWVNRSASSPPWINGIENDGNNASPPNPSCTCATCVEWDGNEKGTGSHSNRYARFWNELQAEGKRQVHGSNPTVIGRAYGSYQLPPKETKLKEGIIVGIVAPPPFSHSPQETQAFQNNWSGWANSYDPPSAAKLFLRPNFLLTGYCMPYIYTHQVSDTYKYAMAHGALATDFDSQQGMWGVQAPNHYVLARLNVNPNYNVEDILQEYYSSFGSAATQIKTYFDYWEGVTAGCDTNFRASFDGGWGSVSMRGDQVFTPTTVMPTVFTQGINLLQAAITAAQSDAQVSQRLEWMRLWLQHADLCMQALAAFHASQAAPTNQQLKQNAATTKAAVDSFRANNPGLIVNVNMLRQCEAWAGWRKSSELP